MTNDSKVRELILGGLPPNPNRVDLRTLGFVGYVSADALDEIERNESRAARVLTTAARFSFR